MDYRASGELLLDCLSFQTDKAIATRLEQLSLADWETMVRQSAKHGVTPLLYHRFRSTGTIAHIPPEVAQELRRICLYSAERNMRRYHEFSRVLNALQKEGIPVIVLKGAALAEMIYENIALRPMADIDLLINSDYTWKADEILTRSGYEMDRSVLLSERHMEWARSIEYRYEIHLVEVHAKIPEIPNLNPWTNARSVRIGLNDTLILGLEDFLLHLCLHTLQHLSPGPAGLIRWYDIAQFIEHYRDEINWDYVVRTTKEHAIEKDIYRTLRAVSEWFGVEIPLHVLSQFRSNGNAILIDDILRAERSEAQEPASLLSHISTIAGVPSNQSRIYHVFRLIFPWRHYMIRRYSINSEKYLYLYYFARLGRGFVKALRTIPLLPDYLKKRNVHHQN